MTESLRKFVREHPNDDPSELLLHASRYQGVDMEAAIIQLKARRRTKDKLPVWHRDDRLFFPSTLAAEQCSSEMTALYKQRLVRSDDWVCDLTGGLGIDTWFFARKARQTTYVEREEVYCSAARYNFSLLGVSTIDVIQGDSLELIASNDRRITGATVFYADPARRGTGNRRLFAIRDCEPDLMKIIDLLPKTCCMIVKLAPMLDMTQALKQLPDTQAIHVVAVKNECKELLMVRSPDASRAQTTISDPTVYCVNFATDGTEQSFRFRLSDEHAATVAFAKQAGRYLYEPNASILKAGAYKSVANRYHVEKLHASSHLYTSNRLITSFPGKSFELAEIIPFCNRMVKTLHVTIPQANITVRNFPISADELRNRTRIADGGNVYLMATTLSDNQKVLLKCNRL